MAKKPLSKSRAVTERGSRHDEGMTVAEETRGSQAPGVSMRPVKRPARKFAQGGDTQMDKARVADYLRDEVDRRENRSARQEAQYQEEQQARRERGGLSRLAMVPEAVRRAQMRVGDRILRDSQEKETAPIRARRDAADREFTDSLGRFADGGMVRGCKPGQMSGKGFRGTY
jgi:hypothetical protein